MASCKDCIHKLLCPVYAPNFDDVLAQGYKCKSYINKADVVEVVRCCECKYNGTSCQLMDLGEPNDFCSLGERSETNAE